MLRSFDGRRTYFFSPFHIESVYKSEANKTEGSITRLEHTQVTASFAKLGFGFVFWGCENKDIFSVLFFIT